MKTFFITLIFLLLLTNISQSKKPFEEKTTIMNVYYSKTSGKYTIKESTEIDPIAIASATYKNSYETKGWDFLTIASYSKDDNKYSDSNKAMQWDMSKELLITKKYIKYIEIYYIFLTIKKEINFLII